MHSDEYPDIDRQDCSSPDVAYVSSYQREAQERDERVMVLTPWTVQNICFEILKNYMTSNPPQREGYVFTQKYDPDEFKTGITLDIAYHYKDAVIQKRPAVYISRSEVSFKFPTLNQMIGANTKESEKSKYAMVEMPIILAVVATNVGFVEQLAEYIFKIFLRYQETIRSDFCIRQFKLVSMSPPQLYMESKDHFLVNVILQTVFDMGTIIKGDDLKLKTMSYTIFTSCAEQPLLRQ
jgi:hypothetical protein